jgi:Cu/Ag efflux protein CusF
LINESFEKGPDLEIIENESLKPLVFFAVTISFWLKQFVSFDKLKEADKTGLVFNVTNVGAEEIVQPFENLAVTK